MEIFTVKQDVSVEYTEKKSLFIGHAFFVTEESEAMAAIASVKKQHAEATHNVWAYSLRKFSAQRFSDDGEPQGTAGMPVLSAIKKYGICDVCIVVTRYFGGILLGAGGLVRAYTKTAAMAIEAAGKTPVVLMSRFRLVCGYDLYNTVCRIAASFGVETESSEFLEKVTVFGRVEAARFESFCKALTEVCYRDLELTELSRECSRLL